MSDPNHVCKIIDKSEQLTLYNRSKSRWERKNARDPTYNFGKHMNWIDENNHGCSHFGIHPELLPRKDLRFDTFHLKCGITKKLMNYLRKFMLNQSITIMNDFSKTILKSFWNDFHIYVWKNKKSFACFQGNEIALFVGNTDSVLSFLERSFVPTTQVSDIIESLKLWFKIFKFLGTTYLDDTDGYQEYKDAMRDFQENLRNFYLVGSRTFLSSTRSTDGREETFYCHALRYYMPEIMKTTFEEHQLGIGIFTMQGFERRNKESKNCMKKFSCNKGNITLNNMKRLFDVFDYDFKDK